MSPSTSPVPHEHHLGNQGRYHVVVNRLLPGSDLVDQGLRDLSEGLETVAALLVSIGAPRLKRAGIRVPGSIPQPEHRLYAVLAAEDANAAHARYNALIRRLVSYERALECAG